MTKTCSWKILAAALAALVSAPAVSAAPSLTAETKVPLAFDDYHGYTGTVAYLKAVARAYPDITELVEIGKSNLDRPIYVLILTNKRTGTTIDAYIKPAHPRGEADPPRQTPDLGKPGQWIDGGTHGNEYTGTEVCLYLIDKLVGGYGTDPVLTKLLDTKVFYVCPTVNPDGVFNSVERGISQRANSLRKDDDGDGRINEDGPDDLNGDGHLTQFRYPDPKGSYVIDEKDPRLMSRMNPDQPSARTRYSVITEDRDNDGDGKRGEDGESGIDVNRNFPEGWWTDEAYAGGTGDYAASSPEARALVEFAVNHRNILSVQNFHTSGGFTYRVPGTAADTALAPKDVAFYDLVLGKKYLEILGEPVPEAWANPARMAEFKEKLRGVTRNRYAVERGYEMPRAWHMGYDELQDRRYGYGMVIDWWYQQFGAYAVTTELWNPAGDIPGFPKIPEGPDSRNEQERALLKLNDEKYGGRLFVPWAAYKHPELGAGEIGGWIPKYRSNALPGDPLREVCEKHWQFEKFRASLLPEIVVTEASGKILAEADSTAAAEAIVKGEAVTIRRSGNRSRVKIVEITAVIENKGPMATHVARGATLRNNREDVVWLVGDRTKLAVLQGGAWQRLGVIDGTLRIPGFASGPARGAQGTRAGTPPELSMRPAGLPQMRGARGGAADEGPPQTGPRREVKWLVAVEGDASLTVVVSSQKGGTAAKAVSVK